MPAMAIRMRISAPAGAGLVALAAAIWYFSKEPEFRRDPLTETAGLLRIAWTYDARYEDCTQERFERNADLRGFALAMVGRAAHTFPAMNDAEAVVFARAAAPGCTLASLMRRKRLYFWRYERHHRTPVDIG